MKLSTFRKTVQIFFLLVFLLTFFFLAYPYPEKWPVKLLLQTEPLTALVSMVAARAIISTMVAGLVVLLLTFVFGR
jgi:hypothetical protein